MVDEVVEQQQAANTEAGRVKVFLVDDHAVLREGVRSVLEATGRIDVVGEAGRTADAVARIAAVRPQVAVIDVQLGDDSGVDLCRHITTTHPSVACLMLTSFPDDDVLFASILAGARGYVLKNVRLDDLIDAIDRVAGGQSLLDSAVTGRVLERIRHPEQGVDPRFASLTPLERTVLGHLVHGRTNKQIAPLVHASDKTVKNYVSSILRKLGLRTRTEAAVFAMRSGQYAAGEQATVGGAPRRN